MKVVDSASSRQLAVEEGRGWAFGSVLVGFRDCGCLLSSLVRSLLVNITIHQLFFFFSALHFSLYFIFSLLLLGLVLVLLTSGLQGHENANWPDSHGHVVSLVRSWVPGGGKLSGRCVEKMCGGRGVWSGERLEWRLLCEGIIEGVPSRKGRKVRARLDEQRLPVWSVG